MSARAFAAGAVVEVRTVAPNAIRPASESRDYGAHLATLVRPYPGGRYDMGSDSWVVSINGRESVAPVSESMMVEVQTVTFADGEVRRVPGTFHPSLRVVGKTWAGLWCVDDSMMPGEPWALTPCCNASATGTESGIACRACYGPVPDECADMGPHLVAVPVES